MPLNVHMLYTPEPSFLDHLKNALADSIMLTFGKKLPESGNAHVLIAGRPDREQLTVCPNLHSLVIPFAGLPEKTRLLMQQFPHIQVYNLHHNATTTAEMTIALMMSVARNLVPADKIFRTHDWTPRYTSMPSVILAGKTVLILGYGAIGQRIARVCRAMDMHVIGIKRTPGNENYPDEVHPPEKLHGLLPRANVMIIALPLTPETENLIGEKELALLPEKAILVNIGRAKVVNEKALYEILRGKKLHGAGLDVWYNYPSDEAGQKNTMPGNYPFHELDNLIMSPHIAGAYGNPDVEFARMDALAKTLNAIARGQDIPNKVNLAAGY